MHLYQLALPIGAIIISLAAIIVAKQSRRNLEKHIAERSKDA